MIRFNISLNDGNWSVKRNGEHYKNAKSYADAISISSNAFYRENIKGGKYASTQIQK